MSALSLQSQQSCSEAWRDTIDLKHLVASLSIDREDFDYQDALVRHGGWGSARRAFGLERLEDLLHNLNEAIAA